VANFSERIGLVRKVLQKDSMDQPLKNALWNATFITYWDATDDYDRFGRILAYAIWSEYFHMPADEFASSRNYIIERTKEYYMACDWNSVYDFVEFVARCELGEDHAHDFADACNFALVRHVSAYRLIRGIITPITSDEEIFALEQAIDQHGTFAAAAHHLKTALSHYSDRSAPDYRNSVKESISAVESVCQVLTGDPNASLGKALKQLDLHSALESGFSKIYGYASDADGIRHALLEKSIVDADDAKFFLVSCSAFVNYLISKSSGRRKT
jgi:hypothetical protein